MSAEWRVPCADAAESWRRLAKQTKAVMPYETSGTVVVIFMHRNGKG